jgi:hypothetical protein
MEASDIYLAARLLIEHFGPEASAQAATNVDLLIARGDVEAAEKWQRVLRAIAEIQAAKRTTH